MRNPLHISNDHKINASLLFFIIVGAQIGVGIHGFQRVVYQDAKQDSWISLILSFALAHLVVIVMMKTLDLYKSNDLFGIQLDIFGKYIGNVLNCIYIFYCASGFMIILKNYIEVINTWVFPYLSTVFLSITILILVCYAFTGGFRVIVGICFFSFFLLIWIPPILILPVQYADFNYILPILDNEFRAISKGVVSMSLSIIGFEILFFCYPFLKETNKYKRYVHLGLLYTMFLYLLILLLTLTFYSGEQLEKTIWATLTLFSIIRLPFLERIELVTICLWLVIILPNLCLYMWIIYRGILRMVNISMEKFAVIFSIIIFVVNLIVNKRTQINVFNDYFGKVAFFIVFIYPFVLFLFALTKKSLTKQRVKKDEEEAQ